MSAADPTNLVRLAIGAMPSSAQADALEVTYLAAAGHGPVEIARRMGRTWPWVEEVRDSIGSAIVGSLRTEGYSPGEIARTLGIPTPVDHAPPTQPASAPGALPRL